MFVDHRAIESGDLWKKKIQKAIHECKSVVAVWSKNSILIDTSTDPISYSIRSEWVDEEVDIAKKRGVLLPIILDEEVASPFGYKNCQTTDFSHWDNRNDHPEFKKLAKKIRVLLEEHERKRIVAEYAEIARQKAELEQRRETLEAQIETARQTEEKRQTELAQQRDELAQQLAQGAADLAPKLVAAEQRTNELNTQLETAREQARFAEQQSAESAKRLAETIAANQSAQQQLAEQQRQTETLQSNLSAQLTALQDQHKRALQQAEAARLSAAEQQHAAEEQKRAADLARQTAENQLRAAQLAQQSQQSEFVQLNQQLSDQQRELTTLRARRSLEEVRNPKDKLIGAALGLVAGGVLTWGLVGNHSEPVVIAATTEHTTAPVSAVQKTPEPTTVEAPTAASAEQTRLQEMQRMKIALRQNGEQTAADALEKLQPLDAEAQLILGAYYYQLQQFQTACPYFKAAADAGNAKAKTLYRKSEKCRKTP